MGGTFLAGSRLQRMTTQRSIEAGRRWPASRGRTRVRGKALLTRHGEPRRGRGFVDGRRGLDV